MEPYGGLRTKGLNPEALAQASETYEDIVMEPEVYTPPEDPKKARLRDLERERALKVGAHKP